MKPGWLRFFDVPGCFRSYPSHSHSHEPIMLTREGEETEVTEEVELNTEDSQGSTFSTLPWSSAPSSEYYSPRIAEMMEKLKRNSGMDKLEFEVESSRVTWSELSPNSVTVGETLATENSRVFRSVQEQWPGANGGFFKEWKEEDWELGEKIAEGAQAEIFEFRGRTRVGCLNTDTDPGVVKMFKEGLSLQDMQQLLPHSLLGDEIVRRWGCFYCGRNCNTINGAMLINGRFAFRMERMWGDLRKLIDVRMIHNHMQVPPITRWDTGQCMLEIARGMKALHRRNITHRDLKAANVLVWGTSKFDALKYPIHCVVADYECSVGVVGTGFWRAPEILLAVKNRNVTPELFSGAADVYSYAMTCYEILTGRVPFELEGFKLNEYDRVIDGYRPTLPSQTSKWMKTLLDRCWHSKPTERPTFEEIVDIIEAEEEDMMKKMMIRRTLAERQASPSESFLVSATK